jgi:NAD(P)-dependent dehydrogenase (short-subunit alcohol dehydrogenase family)
MLLEDRVAIVTAAGSGIGRASALALAREGAQVVVADISPERSAAVAEDILAKGGRAAVQPTDVCDDSQLQTLIERTVRDLGRIDVLHSHAGLQAEGTLEQVAPAAMDASWQTNVRAHFIAARLVVPAMRAQGGGAIIVTASNSGVFYDREMIAYTTTKHAVIAMVRQIAVDYGRDNIRVNALCPGWVDTPFNGPFIKQMGGRAAIEAYVKEKIPLGRWAEAEEIAEAVVFMASDRAAFMTGHALVLDGGESIA